MEATMLRDSPLSSSKGSVGVIWTKPPLRNSEFSNLAQEISVGSNSMLLYNVWLNSPEKMGTKEILLGLENFQTQKGAKLLLVKLVVDIFRNRRGRLSISPPIKTCL